MDLNDDPLGLAIARMIRMARTECGWSQDELADRLGTNQTRVWRLETWDARYMDVELAGRALNQLGVRMRFDTRPSVSPVGGSSATWFTRPARRT